MLFQICNLCRYAAGKIYDVVNFDMTLMIRLPFLPTACEFIYKKGEAQQKIAVSDNTVGGVQVEFN